MPISFIYPIAVIIVCALCTFAERLLPFLVFRKKEVPSLIHYLGRVLPIAIMATLVVYCLRATTFHTMEGYVPQLAAVVITALLHLWRNNTLLSVLGGTLVYMFFVQFLF